MANLAVAMAQGEQRTILVDADLRRPRLHEIFGVSGDRGLTTMFVDPEAMADPPLVDVGVENLWLLPSGPLPPNPADLLGSRRMDEVLAALRARADFLLFDAPPVIPVTDAAVLGRKAGGVLLVMTAGRTRRSHALQAKEILERAHIRLVGVVLTDVPHPGATVLRVGRPRRVFSGTGRRRMTPIQGARLSVSDKTGPVDLAREVAARDVELVRRQR